MTYSAPLEQYGTHAHIAFLIIEEQVGLNRMSQFNPPEVVRANMESETATWTEVIRQADIKLE